MISPKKVATGFLEQNLKGFTLVEILSVLGLLAIVLLICIPFGQSSHQKNQLQVLKDEIKNILHFSKTQALLTRETLILTPLAGSKDWSQGMLLFVDNPKHQYVPGTKVVQEWRFRPRRLKVSWHGFQSNYFLLFSANLRLNATNGYFLIQNNSEQTKLVVNRLARVRKLG